jgi:hypothetical protein
MLRMGFGRVDITPRLELGLRMAGNRPWPRPDGVTWPLYGRVLLADDGATRAAIVCLDLLALPAAEVATLRARLAVVGGLAPDAILVACSHTHRAPFTTLTGPATEDEVFGYLDWLYPRLADAMARAAAQLQPTQITVGEASAAGWVFNRRPIYADGEVGTHGPARGDGFSGMEDTPDETLPILLARTADGAPQGGLVGVACHPTVMENEPVYSADYAGVLTAELEARHGGVFGFLLGASGDVAPPDPTSSDPRHGFGPAHGLAMGRALAERASAALESGRTLTNPRLAVASVRVPLAQRRPTPEQLELACWYLEQAPADLDERAFTRRLTGHTYTFNDGRPPSNAQQVRDLLGMWEWQRRVGAREIVEEVELQAIAFGDLAIVAYPVELFAAFGRRLKAHSPFRDTLLTTLANGWHGYVPTLAAFKHGGYEPQLAYSSRLVPEAGDLLTDAALALLQRLNQSAAPA